MHCNVNAVRVRHVHACSRQGVGIDWGCRQLSAFCCKLYEPGVLASGHVVVNAAYSDQGRYAYRLGADELFVISDGGFLRDIWTPAVVIPLSTNHTSSHVGRRMVAPKHCPGKNRHFDAFADASSHLSTHNDACTKHLQPW